MYDAGLKALIASAFARLRSELRTLAPHLARRVLAWMSALAGSARHEAYFMHPEAFPLLLLPWWLEKSLGGAPDRAFHADLVYSSINGYYYVRLIDSVMDGHGPGDATLLPATAFFHLQFQGAYQRHFEPDHPFWKVFVSESLHASETIVREAALTHVGLREFVQIAAQKTCGMRIPIAAVCFHGRKPKLIRPWWAMCDALGRFAQMLDDVFDWHTDLAANRLTTYFLSEAALRKRRGESITAWIVREGFQWGVAEIHDLLTDVKAHGRTLRSPELVSYLTRQEALLRAEEQGVRAGLASLATLAPLLPPERGRRVNVSIGGRVKR